MSLRVEPERFAGARDSERNGKRHTGVRSFVRRWFTPITVSLALVGFTTAVSLGDRSPRCSRTT